MLNKFKKQMDKLNALMENGLIITQINKTGIIINDKYVIGFDDDFLYIRKIDGVRNYKFMNVSRETLDFKTLKIYIDNLMYDVFHVGTFNLNNMI